MGHQRPILLAALGIIALLVGVAMWLMLPQLVLAQCGSQVSSCKNCHEVEGKHPVNNDGTRWHKAHGFGDFCTLCHGGNQQATDKIAAHTGIVPPLSDVKASCQSCHAADLEARANVYAAILKVTPGYGDVKANLAAATSASTTGAAIAQPTVSPPTEVPSSGLPAVQPAVSMPTPSDLIVNDPNTVDYVQHYDEIVLGQHPTNWGNITLLALIGLLILGGGGFVTYNELRKSAASTATQKVEGEYPAEVVNMLPALARLTARSRDILRSILKQPQKADKVLGVINSLVSDDKTEEDNK